MKRKRFTTEQIIEVLKEAEAGVPAKDLARKHGMSETSFYKWREKFGGMQVSDAKRLKELEDENRRLKRIVADQALDILMLKDVNSKKW
jgi:putative transposase